MKWIWHGGASYGGLSAQICPQQGYSASYHQKRFCSFLLPQSSTFFSFCLWIHLCSLHPTEMLSLLKEFAGKHGGPRRFCLSINIYIENSFKRVDAVDANMITAIKVLSIPLRNLPHLIQKYGIIAWLLSSRKICGHSWTFITFSSRVRGRPEERVMRFLSRDGIVKCRGMFWYV